ncbi:Ig-like domain repeat protein [Nocardioides conyzicola]|uniref:Ig-like domain repeat protein n=1 Tax=Nocardioides conyzicola TaxID=1651781 RepID=UPI0031E820CA
MFVLSAALVFGGTSPIAAAAPQRETAPATVTKTAGTPAAKPKAGLKPLSAAQARSAAADVDLPRPVHGAAAVRLLGDDLDEAAALNDLSTGELVDLLSTDATAWVDQDGMVFFKDAVLDAPSDAPVPAAGAPLDQTFTLHSKAGSQHTIFLDFDGATASATAWHAAYPATPTTQPAWDPSGNGAAFDNTELTSIQAIWESVAEDYAPFDVDVTTADPGAAAINRSSSSDAVFGTHVVISPSTGASAAICNNTCGGVAYTGSMAASAGAGGDGYGYYQPAWVFPHLLGPNSTKAIGEAAAHEAGHTLGLTHDGDAAHPDYNPGHGAWAPIMGGSYDHPISQWSKGDYDGANNQQDDVAVIRSVVGSRLDVAGSSIAQPENFPTGTNYITSRTDVDVYLLGTCSGSVSVSANPTVTAADLDIKLTLLNAAGTVVSTADPASGQVSATVSSGMGATITQPALAQSTYYVAVDGTGNGPWSTGYDDYGSMGAYTMAKTGNCNGAFPTGVPSKANNLTATPDPLAPTVTLSWSAPTTPGAGGAVTGYLLTRSGSDDYVQVPASTTTYTWTGLTLGTGYTFTVTPLNANGVGALSFVSASTSNGTAAPGAPTAVTASWASVAGRAEMTWSPPSFVGSSAIQYYYVYLDGTYLGYLSSAARGANITGLAPGSHTLGVSAVNTMEGQQASAPVTVPTRAANDAFAQRSTISGVTGTVSGDNLESTAEVGETAPVGTRATPGGASVWYSWTAPATGPVTMTTSSTVADRDTILTAYTGTSVASLTKVAGNDEPTAGGHLATVTFDATAGTTYAIAVDGYRTFATGVGPFSLAWSGTATGAKTTTTTLSVTVTGRSATVTAAVTATAGKAVGDLDIFDGSTYVYSGFVNATYPSQTTTVSNLTRGDHTFTARFTPYDTAAFVASDAAPKTVTIAATPTTTALQATANAQTVTLDATVTPSAGTAAGTVEFREGTTLVGTGTVSAGHAVIAVTDVTPGAHSYRATFVPADVERYAGSASGSTSVTVPPLPPAAATSTSLTGQVLGRSATLTATVAAASGTPGGTVQILDAGTVVGTATLTSGSATVTISDLTRGTHPFTATYLPANPATYESSSSTSVLLAVVATPTSTDLTASLSGRTVTLNAAVAPAAGGTVELREGSTLLGTVALSAGSGQLVLTGVAVGTHHYTATFVPADDLRYATSTSSTRDITVDPAVTATALGSAVSFHRVTLTSTVTSAFGAAAGSVTFREGGSVVGTAAVSGGTATTVLTEVATGAHTYRATFTPTDPTDQAGSVSPDHTATVAATPTTTDLTVTVDGQDVSLDAAVATADGVLDGTVELREGSTLLDTRTLVGGAAGIYLSGVSPGAHSYVATFVPSSATHATSSSPTRTVTVSVATTTTLSSSVEGRTVTLDAEVTGPGTPAGSVQFRDGSTLVGTKTLSAGKASLVVADVAPGVHSYTATFVASDPAYGGSVSAPQSVDVDRVASATALVATVDGRAVTLTATVTAGSGTLAGTVQFRDGTNLVALKTLTAGNGTTTATLTSVAFGAHSYTATFVPDGTTHNGSSSPVQVATVLGSTTTTLTADASGRTVTLTAVVATDGTAPPGNVTFYRGTTTPFATAPIVAGTAVLVISDVVPGDYTYSARYTPPAGTTTHGASASAVVAVSVDKVASTTDLQASVSDQTVTLDATVAVGLGTVAGSVQLRDGATVVGTVTLASGAARLTLTNVLPGDHTYTATFVPSSPTVFTGSVSPERTVTVARIATTTGLQAVVSGQTVTLTATPAASARTLTGTVEFYEGTTLLGAVPVSGASVVLPVTDVDPGSHTYSATYVPTGTTHTGSTSPTRTVAVGVRATTTALAVSADVRTVTLDATVTSGARTPAGTVVFKEGSAVLGTVAVADGAASLTLTMVEPWAHSYTATFTPADPAAYAGSVSPAKLVIVAPIVTTTDLTASYAGGLKVDLTALVSGASGAPSGTVTFREGATVVGTAAVFGGFASSTVSVTNVSPGEHTYQATFVPTSAATYAGSVSPARPVTVDPVPTSTSLTTSVTDDSVTLQAGLNAAVAGNMVFREGDDVVGTVAVTGKAAALSLEHVATGEHTYTATFVPSDTAWYAGSVSPARTAIVKVTTVTALTGSASQRTVTLTADVTGPGTPPGAVVFRDGGTVVGTVTADSGTAVLTLTDVVPGAHDYRATFVPANPDHVLGSVSPVRTVIVDPIPTVTTLAAEVDGRSVTLTAGVTGTSGSPTGTVVFREGDTVVRSVAVSSGAATADLTGVTPGTHTYTASFVPANAVTYVASESDPASATVAPIGTDTALEASADGHTVTLDADVTSSYSTPAGDVVFREGAEVVGRAELEAGAASLTLTDVEPGRHTYTAAYVPADADTHAGSLSPEAAVTVAAIATETTLSADAALRTVTLDAGVVAPRGTPAGDVEFREGTDLVGTIALDDGTATLQLTEVEPGEHAYTATFVPTDPVTFSGSGSPERTVTVDPITTTTGLTAEVDVRTVALDAVVDSASSTPAGDVVFRDGDDVVGTVPVDDGAAALELSDVAPGRHTYTATFVASDPVRFGGSVSDEQPVTVAPIVTGTDLAARVDVRTVTLEADVTADSGTPTGEVRFREGADLVGTVAVEDGKATLELTGVAPGEHAYTATYVPADDVTFARSVSDERTVTVDPIVTSTELTPSSDGLDVTLDVQVTGDSGSPTGEVVLRAGDDVLDTLPLVSGAASLVLEDLDPGDHTYSATFVPSDATTYAASSSGDRTVTVGRIATTTELTSKVAERTVTLTATVGTNRGTLAGEVGFYDDYYGELGTAPLVDGTATITLKGVAPGDHPYTATFVPTGSTHAQSAGQRTVTVSGDLVRTTTSLAVTADGRALTLRVQVTSSEPLDTDYVTLSDDDGPFTLVFLDQDGSGEASIPRASIGTHHYRATYEPYPPPYSILAGSSSPVRTVEVAGAATATALTASADGDQVTLSARVTSDAGAPDGSVVFYDGDTRLGDDQHPVWVAEDGTAGTTVQHVLGGSHTYRAVFVPSYAEFVTSATTALVTVDPTATTTDLATQRSKRSVTLTATVDGAIGTPAGSVEFRDGSLVLATVPVVGGTAATTRTAVATGVHDYAAVFVPTDPSVYAGSEAASSLTMGASDTTTALTVTSLRTTVTFAVAVGSVDGVPQGTVEITEGGEPVLSAELVDGAATFALPDAEPGQHAYVATYVPVDDTFGGSASPARSITVTDVAPAATTTTGLTAVAAGRTVTLTAVVGASSGTPVGAVQFREDGVVVDSVPLASGSAVLSRTGVAAGPHTYTATFVPTSAAAYETSTSPSRQVTVAPTATTTALTGALSGTGAALTITVAGADGLVPTGTVQVLDGSVSVGQVQLVGGAAALVVPAVKVGTHSYRATFVPSTGDFTGSTSATLPVTVRPAVSKTTLTAPTKAKAGSRPVVKVKVVRGAAAAAGKVLLTYGTKKVTLTLKAGQASFKLPKVKKGTLKVTASYLGDATTAKSTATRSIKVTK